ncbi:MAG: adenylate/guanylate cyclase domain-containing protein [Gammaproteobacteria bacterium]|nr:adenylate/guanylate cyclase domain-containing protein [Gammaproteobacteria bacterium]
MVVSSSEFLILFGVGLLMCALLPLLTPIQASLLTLAGMVPIWYIGIQVPKPISLLPMEYSLLTILMLYVLNVLAVYFSETRTKQRLMTAFGQYVPPELVGMINENPESFSLSGEAREMTILFCDIRNFTAIAEQLDPKQLVSVLNSIFNPLTKIIHNHLGTIDKYMGDAVMAFWGAPANDPQHAQNAVKAALEIQEKLSRLRPEFKKRGWPEIHMGVGLSSGVVNVGNMGSEYRVAYTVVGDVVNLAARLESVTRSLYTDIVVSESTRGASPDIVFRELAKIKVKGKQDVIKVFQPLGEVGRLSPEQESQLELHNEAMENYYHCRWDTAVTLFGRLWEKTPEDKLYEIYLQNVAEFTKGPRPNDWLGELDVSIGINYPVSTDSTRHQINDLSRIRHPETPVHATSSPEIEPHEDR